uniref:U3 small nucleolar RNA-associated protein 14 homolog A n=1 Tax=Sphenodon punctatus TaxID=8508 RepID=A0A8D0G862_SPHPU
MPGYPAGLSPNSMAAADSLLEEPAQSTSEDEVRQTSEGNDGDGEGRARRHQQLVETLSTLAGERRKAAERTEASRQMSEFNVSSGGEKLLLSELLGPAQALPSLGTIRKQLSKVKQKAAVEVPLSQEETQRVVREAAFAKTSQALAKWDHVVLQNRHAEQLVFPLHQERMAVAPVEEVVRCWQARTPLEQEIFSLLHKTQPPMMDSQMTPWEKASLKAMSLEEAQLRRRELQKARALQSYYESRARREKKIKSKKYHKVLKKGKSRQALQEFEMLRKSNPEAAMEQLEKMERARREERMSLKHQNTGRWARSRAIVAKYDLEARRAMQEQLARNKELTQKVCSAPDSEDIGGNTVDDGGLFVDAVNKMHATMDADNPWMQGKPCSKAKKKPWQVPQELAESAAPEDAGNEEVEEPALSDEEVLLQDFEEHRDLRCQDPCREEAAPVLAEVLPTGPVSPQPEGPLLSEQLGRLHTLEDMEALGSDEQPEGEKALGPEGNEPLGPEQADPAQQPQDGEWKEGVGRAPKKAAKRKKLIDLKAVLTGESQVVQCPPLPSNMQDKEDDDTADQRLVIQEAFVGDDVADFLREKRQTEQATAPQTMDLVLPGWGEWGGVGLRPSARKRRRFLIKPKPGPPRKDGHLPHVILSDQCNVRAIAHQVNTLPLPFSSRQQFERSIQAPLGPTWNTQRAFQRLSAPHILTQPGHIIQPISAEDARLTNQTMPASQFSPLGTTHWHRPKKAL